MPLFQSAQVSTAQMPVPTRHMGFYAEEDLFKAIDEERWLGRHPNRSATIIALLHEALDARARARGETLPQVGDDEGEDDDEPWVGLGREAPDGAGKTGTPTAKAGSRWEYTK